jgi:hypothetical protein
MRHELANLEWSAIKPFLPNKPRGVPRVNGQRECDWVISYLCRQSLPVWKGGEGRISVPSPPPPAPANAFSPSGRAQIFSFVSRVMWVGLLTGPGAK